MKPQFFSIQIATDGAITMGHSEQLAGVIAGLVRTDCQYTAMALPAECRAALRIELLPDGQTVVTAAGEVSACLEQMAKALDKHLSAPAATTTE